ncbi:unnamed protein product, partial [Prorocentrum cordatum]
MPSAVSSEEEQELLGRHGALLTGLAEVLGQDARTEGAAAAASPSRWVGTARGREEEEVPAVVACDAGAGARPCTASGIRLGLAGSSGARSTAELTEHALSERGLDASASPWMEPRPRSGGGEVSQVRATAEITHHALRDRGLNSALFRIGTQVRKSEFSGADTNSISRSKVAVVQR